MEITPNGTATDLADVIDVFYKDPAIQVANRADLSSVPPLGTLTQALAGLGTTGTGHLSPGEAVTITLALKMQETA